MCQDAWRLGMAWEPSRATKIGLGRTGLPEAMAWSQGGPFDDLHVQVYSDSAESEHGPNFCCSEFG